MHMVLSLKGQQKSDSNLYQDRAECLGQMNEF